MLHRNIVSGNDIFITFPVFIKFYYFLETMIHTDGHNVKGIKDFTVKINSPLQSQPLLPVS